MQRYRLIIQVAHFQAIRLGRPLRDRMEGFGVAQRYLRNPVECGRCLRGMGTEKFRNPHGVGMLVAILNVTSRGGHSKNANVDESPLLAQQPRRITKGERNDTNETNRVLRAENTRPTFPFPGEFTSRRPP